MQETSTSFVSQNFLIAIASFTIFALASKRIGKFLSRFSLPLITGYIITGILIGPYILNLLTSNHIPELKFIDRIALPLIGFAAGGELLISTFKKNSKTIILVSTLMTIVTFIFGVLATYIFKSSFPFLQDANSSFLAVVAVLSGLIMISLSPAAVIAIIQEMKAKGPFTSVVLSVVVVLDIVVIVLFAIAFQIAKSVISGGSLSASFLVDLSVELIGSVILGIFLAVLLSFVFRLIKNQTVQIGTTLLFGYGIYTYAPIISEWIHENLHFTFHIESLLVCMVIGFYMSNYTKFHHEFIHALEKAGPMVFLLFFTLTGSTLSLDVLKTTWFIALVLFIMRFLGIGIGSFLGGHIAKIDNSHKRFLPFAFITQSGVTLGLLKIVQDSFSEWGGQFSTIFLAVIVISLVAGAVPFKMALDKVGESNAKEELATAN